MSATPTRELAALAGRLGPYTQATFERAIDLAARLHAEHLTSEHWLAALLADEGCAATRVVLHAFADPETIGAEVLALCPGIMVVGSGHTLPFSVRGVEALHAARTRARLRGSASVEPLDVFGSVLPHLVSDLVARVGSLPGVRLDLPAEDAHDAERVPEEGPLFRHFSLESRRGLGAAARSASGLERRTIAPAHLAFGMLEVDGELRTRTGLTPARWRMAAFGLDDDPTELPERELEADAPLRALLSDLAAGAGTMDVLAWLLARGSAELTALMRRQKVTPALLERCRGAFQDPPVARG